MPLSQSLFGEGSGNIGAAQEAYQKAQAANTPGQGTPIYNVSSNANGMPGTVAGNNLADNSVSTSTPSVNSGLYSNAVNLAQAQAANYAGMGDAALTTAAPTIHNANAGAMRGQLAGINRGYGQLEASLQGGGPNVGQAVYQQGQDAAIANAMGHGGGRAGISAASPALAGAAGAGATARGQQVAAQQTGLAGAYAGQGGMNLQTYGTQQQNAQAQAQLQAGQNAQNDQQALNLYGLSQAQQGAAQDDLQKYNTQAINTVNAGTAHQQTQNNQFMTTLGTVGVVGGAAVAAA